MRGDVLKGHLDLLLLSVLENGPLHGYAIIVALREQSSGAFDLPEGTIYPALHRLENAGHLSTEWDSGSGRRRKLYRVTPQGGTARGEQQLAWTAFASAMSRIVGRPAWTAST